MASRAHAGHGERLAKLARRPGTIALQNLENAVRRIMHGSHSATGGQFINYPDY